MQRSTLANMLFCHKGIVQPKPPVKGGIQAYGNGQTYNTEHQTGEVDSSLLVTSPHILGEGKDIIGCAGLHYAWNLE